MKVSLSGLAPVSDTLCIGVPERVGWQDLTGLLNIDGARYYQVSNRTILIRYNEAVKLPDFAAQCLRVVMQHFGISIEELSIGIHDFLVDEVSVPGLANDIWLRTMTTPTPEPLAQECIEPRGTGPAYWRR
ncbi:MAG TPA: hypothetical protein VFT59_04270 [Candidatus Saccharimonadales bacterium]|nr:hypothetical protein [Candidatus Saccharimonadales bacterium]